MATLKIAHDFRRQTDNLFFILRQCLAGNVNENQKEITRTFLDLERRPSFADIVTLYDSYIETILFFPSWDLSRHILYAISKIKKKKK